MLDEIVDLEKRRSFFDVRARLRLHRHESAADLRRDVDPLDGAKTADGGQTGRPALRFRLDDGDSRGRGRCLRDELLDHLRFGDELEIAEARAQPRKDQEDDDEGDTALQGLNQTSWGGTNDNSVDIN